MGPITLDFEQFLGMRLNEHVLHTWYIEVVDDPTSIRPQQAATLVVDNLQLIARYTATPTGDTRTITITTDEPGCGFTIDLSPDAVNLDRDRRSRTEIWCFPPKPSPASSTAGWTPNTGLPTWKVPTSSSCGVCFPGP